MSEIYIPTETEGLTIARIKPHSEAIAGLGFTFMASHGGVFTAAELAKANKLVDTRAELTSVDTMPLMNNAIYLYCRPSTILYTEMTASKKLFKRTLKKQYNILLNLLGNEETDYIQLMDQNQVLKVADVLFSSQFGSCGFYNMKHNLLWLGDLTHFRPERYLMQAIDALAAIKRGEMDVARSKYIHPNTLTWGADPEFEVYDKGGSHIPANHVIPDDPTAQVGCDGWNVTGEVRPKPSPSPLGLARNIKRLMYSMAFTNKLIDYDVEAGAGRTHHLGGHIHVSTQIPQDHQLVLYDLVGQPVLNWMRGPRKDRVADLVGRGAWDAVRPNPRKNDPLPHSGQEWRQLPSFIESEETTKICLCTTAMVIKELQVEEIDPKKTAKMSAEEKVNFLKSMKLYETYKQYVDEFIKRFYSQGYSMEGKKVFDGWRIKKPASVKTLSMECAHPGLKAYFPSVVIPNRKRSVLIKLLFQNEGAARLYFTEGMVNNADLDSIDKVLRRFCRRAVLTPSIEMAGRRGLGATDDVDVIMISLPPGWRRHSADLVAAQIGEVVKTITKSILK